MNEGETEREIDFMYCVFEVNRNLKMRLFCFDFSLKEFQIIFT